MAKSKVFIDNGIQLVSLPTELRLPTGVGMVDGPAWDDERITSPAGQIWDSFFLEGHPVSDDFLSQDSVEPPNEGTLSSS